ncbi:hypothetical protein [Runella sp.]|uniref:hypothetical protein n=1 Tax=Runella sp. TaxID=1960881 RepID=UPI003D098E5A
MDIKPIKTETDYFIKLKRMEKIFDAVVGTPESDEADILGAMIEEYEKKHHQIETSKITIDLPL